MTFLPVRPANAWMFSTKALGNVMAPAPTQGKPTQPETVGAQNSYRGHHPPKRQNALVVSRDV